MPALCGMTDLPTDSTDFQKLIATHQAINLSIIMSVTDKNGIIKSANDKFCEISQYSEEELIGKSHNIVNSAYHPKEFFKEMWSTIKGGNPWMGEIKNKAKDGTYYWVETVIVPVLNNGEIEEFVSLRILITNRKTSEEKLLSSEKRYRTLVENLPDKIALSKPDGRLIYANVNYSAFFGKTQKELEGKTNHLFVPKDKQDEFLAQMKSITPENPYFSNTFILKDKHNKERHILWREVGIFNNQGELSELLSVGRDISTLKKAEEMKDEYIAQLEKMAFATSHQLRHSLATLLSISTLLDVADLDQDELTKMLHYIKPALDQLDDFTKEMAVNIHTLRSKIT